jgi:hypothetical protein
VGDHGSAYEQRRRDTYGALIACNKYKIEVFEHLGRFAIIITMPYSAVFFLQFANHEVLADFWKV